MLIFILWSIILSINRIESKINALDSVSSIELSTATCIEQPKLILNITELEPSSLVNYGDDFLDLNVGSNLTFICVGQMIDDSSNSLLLPTSLNTTEDNQIHWILPEYHPVKYYLFFY